MSRPRNSTRPSVAVSSRTMMRPSVVLPQPLSPDQAQGLFGVDVEANSRHGAQTARRPEEAPMWEIEDLNHVLNLEQGRGTRGHQYR